MAHVFIALHVILAVFIIGPMALLPHTGLRALRNFDAKQVRGLARSVSIFSWASLVVFVLGFAALGTADIPFTRLWVWLSVVLYAGAFVLSVFVIVPNLRRGAEEIEGAAAPAEGEKLRRPAAYSAVAATAGVSTILLVVVVILMAFRP
ncbi:DUF2269 family protein [Gryllotalpicola protaetiae]|uniref:DUF2269 family protein n=1 Tax=Gryllotalpicola protaetiae TaxID=2419771 RepID=A0A387BJE6_9MICO|nr:DUF2269 family protein [Gryllotalpicola protaetiae]AYG04225.1 DUF2269 family protein [Gryllotalpicola protaetiae]